MKVAERAARPSSRRSARRGPTGATEKLPSPNRGAEAPGAAWRERELRLPILLAILFATCTLFLQVLPNDPPLHERLMHMFRGASSDAERELARLRAKDPKIGAILPIPAATGGRRPRVTGRSGEEAAAHSLVVMIGSCSACVVTELRAIERLANEFPGVAVSSSPPAAVAKFRREQRLRLRIVSDVQNRLASAYNAAWQPRAYVVSSSGELRWRQERFALDKGELRTVLASLGERR